MSRVIECWRSLHSCRSQHTQAIPVGPGQFAHVSYDGLIRHDAITDWCRWHGLDYETGEMVISTIHILDSDRMARIQSEINLQT